MVFTYTNFLVNMQVLVLLNVEKVVCIILYNYIRIHLYWMQILNLHYLIQIYLCQYSNLLVCSIWILIYYCDFTMYVWRYCYAEILLVHYLYMLYVWFYLSFYLLYYHKFLLLLRNCYFINFNNLFLGMIFVLIGVVWLNIIYTFPSWWWVRDVAELVFVGVFLASFLIYHIKLIHYWDQIIIVVNLYTLLVLGLCYRGILPTGLIHSQLYYYNYESIYLGVIGVVGVYWGIFQVCKFKYRIYLYNFQNRYQAFGNLVMILVGVLVSISFINIGVVDIFMYFLYLIWYGVAVDIIAYLWFSGIYMYQLETVVNVNFLISINVLYLFKLIFIHYQMWYMCLTIMWVVGNVISCYTYLSFFQWWIMFQCFGLEVFWKLKITKFKK